MSSAAGLWWLALPLLLLPIWWHREKRQRTQAQPLATARFLPAAAPQQQRIWRWVDKLLLLLRCLLLLGVIAWLADVVLPWRGDTVWLGPELDAAVVDAQLKQAGLTQAQRLSFCTDGSEACDVHTANILAWLTAHESEWRGDARWLLIANAGDVPMPARPPALAHRLDMRVLAASASAPAPRVDRHVVLVTDSADRAERWRALFTAFEAAGLGNEHYLITSSPNAQTELIVWDRRETPNATWRAPLWWVVDAAAFPELAQVPSVPHPPILPNLPNFRYADTPRGRLWALDDWPLNDIEGARALFQTWQALQRAPVAYAPPSQVLTAGPSVRSEGPAGALHAVFAPLLAALFALERLLAHVGRG